MNTKALNSLADLICRAQEQGKRTPMGIAMAIDSAGRHMSPETADELEQLRRSVETNRVDGQRLIRAEQRRAELEAVLDTHRRDDQAEIERLRKQVAELLAERHTTNEALDDAVQELRARRSLTDAEAAVMWTKVDEATPGHIFKYEYQRIVRAALGAVGIPLAGADEDETDESADRLTRLLAPTQALREVPDGEHYAATHREYRVGHDLPETGGAR